METLMPRPPPSKLIRHLELKKKGKAPILSESEVRHSLRIKKLHKRFKNLGCKDKSCLGCTSTPPVISPSIIRDLGATFCNINAEELTDAKLHVKPTNTKPVAKGNGTKKPSTSSKKDGAQ